MVNAILILGQPNSRFVTLKTSKKDQQSDRLGFMQPGSASDELHRIVPIGLTLGEARAWYVNHILIPRLRSASIFSLAGFAVLLSMLTNLGESLDGNLTTHIVVQQFLFIVAGFLLAFAPYSVLEVAPQLSYKASRARELMKRTGLGANKLAVLLLPAAASLIAIWNLPAQVDEAAIGVALHAEMLASLVFAGSLIFVGSRFLSRRTRLVAPVIVGKALGLYGMFLLGTPFPVYRAYPAYEQAYAGVVLLIVMLVLDFTIMPLWLYSYFGKVAAVKPPALD